MKIVDTHLHLIEPERFAYPWIQDAPSLNQATPFNEYRKIMSSYGDFKSIFMEVDVSEGDALSEAQFFSKKNHDYEELSGVIAKAFPESEKFAEQVSSLQATSSLCGIRRVLHVVPNELSKSAIFRKNIAWLGSQGLPFDLCLREQQLSMGVELVEKCPSTIFILDHAGCPDIARGDFARWESLMKKMQEFPNLFVKVSGLITCVPENKDFSESLTPYWETLLEIFGPNRLLFGSDYPVCNLRGTLDDWMSLFMRWVNELSPFEQEAIRFRNAEKIYLNK